MIHECKFCGKKFSVPHFLSTEPGSLSCGECSAYCIKSCEIARSTTASWHREPCVSCEKDPYRIRHTWNGKEWVKNA